MLDPHTGAELSLDEIAALVDDLLEAHGVPAGAASSLDERPRVGG